MCGQQTRRHGEAECTVTPRRGRRPAQDSSFLYGVSRADQPGLSLAGARRARAAVETRHAAVRSRRVSVRPGDVAVAPGDVPLATEEAASMSVVGGRRFGESLVVVAALDQLVAGACGLAILRRQLRGRRQRDWPQSEPALAVLRVEAGAARALVAHAAALGAALLALPLELGARAGVVQAPPKAPHPEAETEHPARMLASGKSWRGGRWHTHNDSAGDERIGLVRVADYHAVDDAQHEPGDSGERILDEHVDRERRGHHRPHQEGAVQGQTEAGHRDGAGRRRHQRTIRAPMTDGENSQESAAGEEHQHQHHHVQGRLHRQSGDASDPVLGRNRLFRFVASGSIATNRPRRRSATRRGRADRRRRTAYHRADRTAWYG